MRDPTFSRLSLQNDCKNYGTGVTQQVKFAKIAV